MFTKNLFKRQLKSKKVLHSIRNFSKLQCPETGFSDIRDENSDAIIIDGKEISSKIKNLLIKEIDYLRSHHTPSITNQPKLGYVIVGKRPDSNLYVKMK